MIGEPSSGRIELVIPTIVVVSSARRSDDDRAHYWNGIYTTREANKLSWYQSEPTVSLGLVDQLDLGVTATVIDVGAGSSLFVDRLLQRGFEDITVMDISAKAVTDVRLRVGETSRVMTIVGDLLEWRPHRRFDLWHDRAVLHFLDRGEISEYAKTLRRALADDGSAILGAIALEGPDRCSGLPVVRYDTDGLMAVLGPQFELVAQCREEHVTPSGAVQPFNWIAANRTRA